MGGVSSPSCPFCNARGAERVGHWGGQIITAQWRCLDCGSYFEAVRADFDTEEGLFPGPPFKRAESSPPASKARP